MVWRRARGLEARARFGGGRAVWRRARTIMPPFETSMGCTAIILRCSRRSSTALIIFRPIQPMPASRVTQRWGARRHGVVEREEHWHRIQRAVVVVLVGVALVVAVMAVAAKEVEVRVVVLLVEMMVARTDWRKMDVV